MIADLHSLLGLLPPEIAPSATKLGLVLPSDLPRETWVRLAGRLAQASGARASRAETLTAWLGDLLAHSGRSHRGLISELATVAGLSPATLRNTKLVCSRIPVSCRRDTLPWAHHCEVGKAFESPEEIGRWLDIAATEKLSKALLRMRIRLYKKGLRGGGDLEARIDVSTFSLLRDLRVTDRLVSTQHDIWQRWSPATCRAALQEIKHLSEFVDKLAERAEKPAA